MAGMLLERLNLEGPPLLGSLPYLFPLSIQKFSDKKKQAKILDTRKELDFISAFVPGSISMWMEGIASFAGWFLSYDDPILLVTEADDPNKIVRFLLRMGYDDLGGFAGWNSITCPIQKQEKQPDEKEGEFFYMIF